MKEKTKRQLAQEVTMLHRVVAERDKSLGDLQQMEARSRKAAQKFRTVADTTHDWEFWFSADAQFIYSSPSCERITGYTADEFEKDPTLFYRIIHPEDLSRVTDHLGRRKKNSGYAEIEFRIRHRDGSERWLASAFQPVYDSASRFLGTRGSNADATARKQVEANHEALVHELRSILSQVTIFKGWRSNGVHCMDSSDGKGCGGPAEAAGGNDAEAVVSHGIRSGDSAESCPGIVDPASLKRHGTKGSFGSAMP